jgi:hypothetical protein
VVGQGRNPQLIKLVETLDSRVEAMGRDLAGLAAKAQLFETEVHFNKVAEALLDSPRYRKLLEEHTETRLRAIAKNVDGWFGRPFLNNRETAKIIGVTPVHLSAMRKRGEGPKWSGSGKWVRYERAAVEGWLRDLPKR